ncbi:hypothetical protein [Nocardia sp. NPDC050793]|uniref:hypothetical protein n=1 Tax=Nocardia sp. NPDC050793 TaxID=3155159 RepID=UPI0034001D6C
MSDNPTPAVSEVVLVGDALTSPTAPAVGERPAPAPADPPAEPAKPKTDWTPEEATAEIAKLRSENADWRRKYRDAEPIMKAHNEAQEAAKTEVQRATDQLTAAQQTIANLTRETVAAKYGVPEEDYDFLGSGTREEMEAKGARYQARFAPAPAPTPPPSDRPVEGLRPGASPTPPAQPDNSYPESWRPAPPRGRT